MGRIVVKCKLVLFSFILVFDEKDADFKRFIVTKPRYL